MILSQKIICNSFHQHMYSAKYNDDQNLNNIFYQLKYLPLTCRTMTTLKFYWNFTSYTGFNNLFILFYVIHDSFIQNKSYLSKSPFFYAIISSSVESIWPVRAENVINPNKLNVNMHIIDILIDSLW